MPKNRVSSVARVLHLAAAELGYREQPPGSNRTKYGAWYGADGQPWCAMFVSWVLAQAGIILPIQNARGFAFCPYGVNWFKKNGLWHTSNPQPGDVVFFDWYPGTARSGAWHVGFVESVRADGTLVTIEGNTSVASNDNGGQVMRRSRSRSLVLGFGRPKYNLIATAPPKPSQPQLHSIAISFPDGSQVPGWLIEDAGKAESWVRVNDLERLGLNGDWDGAARKTQILDSRA